VALCPLPPPTLGPPSLIHYLETTPPSPPYTPSSESPHLAPEARQKLYLFTYILICSCIIMSMYAPGPRSQAETVLVYIHTHIFIYNYIYMYTPGQSSEWSEGGPGSLTGRCSKPQAVPCLVGENKSSWAARTARQLRSARATG
jgi:hypothetical protein